MLRRIAMTKVAAVLASLLLAACGQSSASQPREKVATGDAPPVTRTAAEDGDGDCGIAYSGRPDASGEEVPDATPYVGKTLPEARAHATAAGHELRVAGEDGRCFVLIQNLRRDRVNVFVVDGKVEAAGHF